MNIGKFNTRIKLIDYEITYDDAGNSIKTPIETEVWAMKKSITQNEFYQAQVAGLKPEFKFVIRSQNYNNHKAIKYNGEIYKIIRVYTTDDWTTELTCEKVIGNGK